MYHLMSYLDLEDGVLYAQGGFNRVIESIRDIAVAEGVNLITEANVSKILTVVNPAGHKAKAKAAGVEEVYFDRGGRLFHGKIKALAEAAREGGLKF